jgi:hypothetical protein
MVDGTLCSSMSTSDLERRLKSVVSEISKIGRHPTDRGADTGRGISEFRVSQTEVLPPILGKVGVVSCDEVTRKFDDDSSRTRPRGRLAQVPYVSHFDCRPLTSPRTRAFVFALDNPFLRTSPSRTSSIEHHGSSFPSFVSSVVANNDTCKNPKVRREWRALSLGEQGE